MIVVIIFVVAIADVIIVICTPRLPLYVAHDHVNIMMIIFMIIMMIMVVIIMMITKIT